ncbi:MULTISPECIES: pheA operon leader peptide PheL [Pseudocitrobacter]|nr:MULTISPECIES: pheA operon leader peptide PheL [Pseudocitrobacter]MDF3830090.1 pheA operon leader peptide PheL [Pseudocitrobacter sp. 2023EL-00150]MEB4674163.1 pheA operon leader peptide PheL [Enterobacteriaceae bacterium G50]MEC5375699.1 pheA operon leader peptide PheL [Pseudocitrobacter sp. MW920760]UYW75603.1 pheA operon leader peptide PheL [Pseudocitrobacter faecalis]
MKSVLFFFAFFFTFP